MYPQVLQARSVAMLPRPMRRAGVAPHFRQAVFMSVRSERDGTIPMLFCPLLRVAFPSALLAVVVLVGVVVFTSSFVRDSSPYGPDSLLRRPDWRRGLLDRDARLVLQRVCRQWSGSRH